MVQWLGLHAFIAEGPGSIPGQRTKIPQAVRHGQKNESEFLTLKMEKGCHEPRNAGSLPELEKARKQIILYSLRKEHSLANLDFSPVRPVSDF